MFRVHVMVLLLIWAEHGERDISILRTIMIPWYIILLSGQTL